MYTEDDEKRRFPLRDFLLKLILIVVFVLLLVWLLPIPNLTGLNNRIFNANVQEMKDAAISYFTTERLPQKEGDSVTLTLQEMLDMKLLLPFTDKDGKSCDTRNSYVTLTKKANEYEMKVYLKCSEEEDYIIIHLGCYSYCENAICEKEKTEEKGGEKQDKVVVVPKTGAPYCQLVVTGSKGENGWYTGNATIKFKSKGTTTSSAKITGYGIGTSTTYSKNTSYVVSKDGTTKVYGYVKDSKGKTAICSVSVKKDTAKPKCVVDVLSGTKNSNGQYITNVKVGFTSKVDGTSGIAKYGVTDSSSVNYNSNTSYTVSKNGTTTVYGFVKDKAGHAAVCSKQITKIKVEEDKISEPSCSLTATGNIGNNNWYVGNATIKFASKKTTNGATITAYGIGTSTIYSNNTSYVVNKDGTNTIYGYVKDSKGNTSVCSIVIKRDATKPNCSLDASGTYKDGYYTSNITIGFASRSDATSGVNSYGIGISTTYDNKSTYTISNNGTHTIYGYIKDNAGNTNVCSKTVIKKDNSYEYEYVKNIEEKWSDWSSWTTSTYSKSNPPQFVSTSTKQVVDLGGTSKLTGYKYTVGDPIWGKQSRLVLSTTEKVCKGYDYYRTSTSSTTTYAVKVAENDGWVYRGTVVSAIQPEPDTLSKKYIPYGMDYSTCNPECTSAPLIKWKVYTREVSKVTASDTVTTSTGIKVKCSGYETKQTFLYSTATIVIGYKEVRTPVYETIYQYKYRTKTLLQKAETKTTWSVIINDSTLINNGYKMTGNKRVKG